MLTKCGYVVVGTSRPRKSVIHMVDFFFWLKSRVFTNFFQGVAQDDGRRCKKWRHFQNSSRRKWIFLLLRTSFSPKCWPFCCLKMESSLLRRELCFIYSKNSVAKTQRKTMTDVLYILRHFLAATTAAVVVVSTFRKVFYFSQKFC